MTRRGLPFIFGLLVGQAALAGADPPVPVPGHTLLNVPVQSLMALRFKNVVRQAHDVSCGAAAMATLLTYYYGQPATEQDLVQQMLQYGDKAKIEKDGFSLLEMKRYAEARGFVAAGYRVDNVQGLTKLRVPAIALITVRGYTHFVVLKGVAQGQVFLADPAFGNRSRPLADFGQEWNRILLVVLSRTQGGQNAFTFDPTLRAPVKDVMLLIDRGVRSLGRGPGEF